MKYLLVLGIALLVVWLWRHNRADERRDAQPRARPAPRQTALPATEIVACDVCQVHLPRNEALAHGRGMYCSEAHRRQAEAG